jgi:hypothetical protein
MPCLPETTTNRVDCIVSALASLNSRRSIHNEPTRLPVSDGTINDESGKGEKTVATRDRVSTKTS